MKKSASRLIADYYRMLIKQKGYVPVERIKVPGSPTGEEIDNQITIPVKYLNQLIKEVKVK